MKFLSKFLICAAVALLPALTAAQAWPAKPVKLVVPFPGGAL